MIITEARDSRASRWRDVAHEHVVQGLSRCPLQTFSWLRRLGRVGYSLWPKGITRRSSSANAHNTKLAAKMIIEG